MNGKVINLFIGIIIGCMVTGIGGYYLIYRPDIYSIRTELNASRADAEFYRSRATESERRINNVAGIITESTTTISGTITTIQQARDKIRTIIETLRKIREMVENKELDNDR